MATEKVKLTKTVVDDAPRKDKRYILWDDSLKGFGLMIQPTGAKSFVVQARIGKGRAGKDRREVIGIPDEVMTAAKARERAKEWLAKTVTGIDPVQAERDAAAAKAQALADRQIQQKRIFRNIAERYIGEVLKNKRTGASLESIIRRRLIPAWGDRDIGTIQKDEISDLVDGIAKAGQPSAAIKCHRSVISPLFTWADGKGQLNLDRNPAQKLKIDVSDTQRARVLTDAELRGVWIASDSLGCPFGPWVKVLILTGLRRTEAASAEWSEIDLAEKVWVVPAARMKGNRDHAVPLAPSVVAILESIPKESQYVFTSTVKTTKKGKEGKREPAPISGFSKTKARIDQRISANRKSLAEKVGLDPSAVTAMPDWTIHDLRRTMRTGLSALGVLPHVAELCIAHIPPELRGVGGTYDRYKFLPEKRLAFEAWAVRVQSLVDAKQSADSAI